MIHIQIEISDGDEGHTITEVTVMAHNPEPPVLRQAIWTLSVLRALSNYDESDELLTELGMQRVREMTDDLIKGMGLPISNLLEGIEGIGGGERSCLKFYGI